MTMTLGVTPPRAISLGGAVPINAALSTGLLAGVGTLLYFLAGANTREGEVTRFVG